MDSLLGQFYSRIKGSQEDIASEGLVYILSRSKSACETLREIIYKECGLTLPELSFISQSTGTNLERTDISGHDNNGNERLIIESKFWASLTENQPVAYLNRLEKDSLLMFICPELRIVSIADEVSKRLTNDGLTFEVRNESTSYRLSGDKYIIFKTWEKILGPIKLALSQENNLALISDIDQIIGFCNIIDTEAFLPITAEDMSPRIARRINSYYDLIDKVIQEMEKRSFAGTKKLRATGQKYGYTRFFNTERFGVGLYVSFDSWAKEADTPFWLWMNEREEGTGHWFRSNIIYRACKEVAAQKKYKLVLAPNNSTYFALFPLLNKTEDLVINDMVYQIMMIIELVERKMDTL